MTDKLFCIKCNIETDYTLTKNNMHLSAYCNICNSFIKNISHKEVYRSKENLAIAWDKTKGCCAYCGTLKNPYREPSYDIDHIISKKNLGSNDIENLFLSCHHCNTQKGSKTIEQYREYLKKKNGTDEYIFYFETIRNIINEMLNNQNNG